MNHLCYVYCGSFRGIHKFCKTFIFFLLFLFRPSAAKTPHTIVTMFNSSNKSHKKQKEISGKIDSSIFISISANIRHREFYARPKRLQKTVWPPQEFDSNNSSKRSSTNDSIVNNENSGDSMSSSKTLSDHSDNNITIQRGTDVMPLQVKSTNTLPPHRLANHLAREQFYNGIHSDHNIPSQSLQQQHQQYLQQRAMDAEGNWYDRMRISVILVHFFKSISFTVLVVCCHHRLVYILSRNVPNNLSPVVLCHRMEVPWIERHYIVVK